MYRKCWNLRTISNFGLYWFLQFADDCISDCLIFANSSFVIPVVWCFIALFLAALIFQGILDELFGSPSRGTKGSSFPVENSLRATGSFVWITWFLLIFRWFSSSSILFESTGLDEAMVPLSALCLKYKYIWKTPRVNETVVYLGDNVEISNWAR